MTMVEVEKFDIAQQPDRGRPRIVEFRGREGLLAMHCERESGALYLFAYGPRGGDHGMVVFAPWTSNVRAGQALRRHDSEVLASYRGGSLRAGTNGTLLIQHVEDGCATVRIEPRRGRGGWTMRLDRNAYAELKAALRAWGEAVQRTTVEDSVS